MGDSSLLREPIRVAILDARDAAHPAPPFGRGGLVDGFTESDLANLLKNTVRRDSWEEADGRTLMIHRGFFFIQNTDSVIRDSAAFIDERRFKKAPRVALRAETLDLPVEELGGAGAGLLIEDARRERLLSAASRVDRREWTSFDGQNSCLEWERTPGVSSFIEARAVVRQDRGSIDLGLDFHDEGAPAISTATTIEIPIGRTAIFRAAAGGRARLLLVTPSLLR
jgi:hypothetical protein